MLSGNYKKHRVKRIIKLSDVHCECIITTDDLLLSDTISICLLQCIVLLTYYGSDTLYVCFCKGCDAIDNFLFHYLFSLLINLRLFQTTVRQLLRRIYQRISEHVAYKCH